MTCNNLNSYNMFHQAKEVLILCFGQSVILLQQAELIKRCVPYFRISLISVINTEKLLRTLFRMASLLNNIRLLFTEGVNCLQNLLRGLDSHDNIICGVLLHLSRFSRRFRF